MTSRHVFLLIAVLASTPAPASAQQSSSSPRAATVTSLQQGSRVWRQLNFGVPKLPEASEPLGTSRSQWMPAAHVPGIGAWFQKPELAKMTQVTPAPIDCAMARPGDPSLDTKMVHRHQAARTLSAVIIPVAPCTKK